METGSLPHYELTRQFYCKHGYEQHALLKDFYASGKLVPPDVVARKIVDRLVVVPVEHGRTYSYAEL